VTREHYLQELGRLDQSVRTLGELVLHAATSSIRSLERMDVSRARDIVEEDSRIDTMRHDIEREAFVLIATQQPAATDLRAILGSWMIASELERIADYCAGIAKLTLTISQETQANELPSMVSSIANMSTLTVDLLDQSLKAFHNRDLALATETWKADDRVDDQYAEIFRQTVDEMVQHKSHIRTGTYLLWVAHNIERIADRVTNIAEIVAFVDTGNVPNFREQNLSETVPN
jgi:phosphate transport system protein